MVAKAKSNIYIGVGGWTFEPWRGEFLSRRPGRRSESSNMRAGI